MAHTTETITTALTVLAEYGGKAADAARALAEDNLDINADTLRRWKNDTHAERYRQIEERYGQEMEARAILRSRQIIEKAATIEEELLEKVRESSGDLAPQALRAVADVKAKNVNAVLQWQGRPTNPRDNSGSDVVKLFQGMVDKGWLKMAPGVELEPPKRDA